MGNTEEEAKAWRDRECATSFVATKLAEGDRISVDRPDDPETTYTLSRPSAGRAPIFKSGDCADVRKAIEMGLLERADDGTYRKRSRKP
jgi:hypothetical protein